ncbi:MAG: hypothetical protein GX220_07120 [Treponema sp.]|nr:hypothetical protein [Treponema sp.]
MNRRIAFFVIIVILLLLGFSGCVSVLPEHPEKNYLSYFSSNNDLYVYFPVKNNETFVKSVAQNLFKQLSDSDIEKIIARTNYVFFATSSLEKKDNLTKNFQSIVVGNYPKIFVKNSLNEKNGWQKKDNYYAHNSGINLYFSQSGNIYISTSNPTNINEQNKNNAQIYFSDQISYLVTNPSLFIDLFLGKINLPISEIFGVLTKFNNDEFYTDVILNFSDNRAIKPATLILKIAGIENEIIETNEKKIKLKNIKIKNEVLKNFFYK